MPEKISLLSLAIAFIPVAVVIGILWAWKGTYRTALIALSRMLVQLLMVGYVLSTIFSAQEAWIIGCVLLVMICVATWISLRTVPNKRLQLVWVAAIAILVGGGSVLGVIILGVLRPDPWFAPRFVVPLAGMIFANCMNAISLAVERFFAELEQGKELIESRRIALEASLIPTTNSLLAVGLVSIPGMMTGQVLAGVAPHVAARYQIMVMCMVYGSAGITAAIFLQLAPKVTGLITDDRAVSHSEQ